MFVVSLRVAVLISLAGVLMRLPVDCVFCRSLLCCLLRLALDYCVYVLLWLCVDNCLLSVVFCAFCWFESGFASCVWGVCFLLVCLLICCPFIWCLFCCGFLQRLVGCLLICLFELVGCIDVWWFTDCCGFACFIRWFLVALCVCVCCHCLLLLSFGDL